MLTLHLANRTETLRDALLEALATPPADPFAAEQVIVPNAALKRWLTLAISRQRGICAQVEFAFLGQWLWSLMGRFVPIAAQSPFAARVLGWRVLDWLADPSQSTGHGRLADWLGAATPAQRLALAQQIGSVFDHYVTYRGDWLAHWRAGRKVPGLSAAARPDEAWQKALWQWLMAPGGQPDAAPGHPAAAFLAALAAPGEAAAAARQRLPHQVAVFGLPAMAPLYLDLLGRIAQHTDIHVFALNPCREYWTDVVDPKHLQRLQAMGRARYHTDGNPLLAAWGKQTRALIGQLIEATGDDGAPTLFDDERHVEATGGGRLQALQNAILKFEPLDPGALRPVTAAGADRSLEIHACHSLTRQIEALHDQLLGAFADDPTLTPGEVLVGCVDLDAAAPLIDAIFGAADDDRRRIPYAIAGRAEHAGNPVADLLLRLVTLADSRLPASEMFDLLQAPLIARRFHLSDDDLDRLHALLAAADVRWGLDAGQRHAVGAPPVDGDRHSLADGLQRLLLGLAVDDADTGLIGDCLPLAAVDDADAPLIEILWQLHAALSALQQTLARPAAAPQWPPRLLAVLRAWLRPETDAEWSQWQIVRDAIDQLAADIDTAQTTQVLDLATVRVALRAALDESAQGGVAGGSVSFSALPAFRGVPARLICLIGVEDEAFPARPSPVEFDLIAREAAAGHGRQGDRQRRDDDRNLFLDLLLAARDRFLIFYNGRSVRDNAHQPPSILIAELLDHLLPALMPADIDTAPAEERATALAAARREVVVEHPLQPFATALFDPADDPRRASFAAEYCRALQTPPPAGTPVASAPPDVGDDSDDTDDDTDDRAPAAGTPFFLPGRPLAPLSEAERQVTLATLARFLTHPARSLIRRLGIDIERQRQTLVDDEAFALDPYPLRWRWPTLLPLVQAGADAATLDAHLAASGLFPAGPTGVAARRQAAADLRRDADRLAQFPPLPAAAEDESRPGIDLSVSIDGERWTLTGRVDGLGVTATARGQLLWTAQKRSARDWLPLWLAHLSGTLAPAAAGMSGETWHLGKDDAVCLRPLSTADARRHLHRLLACYANGLRAPLPLYPKAAWAFAEKDAAGKPEAALAAARSAWRGSRPHAGESADPWIALACRGMEDPLGNDFADLARQLFGPIVEARAT